MYLRCVLATVGLFLEKEEHQEEGKPVMFLKWLGRKTIPGQLPGITDLQQFLCPP